MNHLPPLICKLLADPACYDHAVVAVQLIETHISWVLLTGEYAYKIKKPVNLGFLDFSTLALRQRACADEVRLNQRLAADTYLGVVAIAGNADAPQINGRGEAIEYAVRMRQFPLDAALDHMDERGELGAIQIDRLAARLAQFHLGECARAPADSPWGEPEVIAQPVAENFQLLSSRLNDPTESQRIAALHDWSNAEHARLTPLMRERKRNGWIRECHGDLHLGNIAWVNEQILIFDCIEFSTALRWIDVISEVAFCFMDLLQKHPHPNGHGKDAAPDNETCHACFPLSNFPPQAGERANESLREFHVNLPLEGYPHPNPLPEGEGSIALSPSGGKMDRGLGTIASSPPGGRIEERVGNHRDLAMRFLNAWLEASGDYAGVPLLRYYAVYRALVRAKVATLRAEQFDGSDAVASRAEIRACLQLAESLSQNMPAQLWITHGLSGSGKTTLTQMLLQEHGMIRLRSDVERKRLAGLDALEHSGGEAGGLYTQDASRRTYAHLARLAEMLLGAGWAVVVDAAFLMRWQRDLFREIAQRHEVSFRILDIHADLATLRERITLRAAQGKDASEADLRVLQQQIETMQPLDADELTTAT